MKTIRFNLFTLLLILSISTNIQARRTLDTMDDIIDASLDPDGKSSISTVELSTDSWYIDVVGGDANKQHLSLASDALGQLHITYVINNELRYARYDGDEWQIEVVDTLVSSDQGYVATSLAVDGPGHPHIAYSVYVRSTWDTWHLLNYARHDGIEWQIENDVGPGGHEISMILDELDRPHVALINLDYDRFTTYHQLYYAWRDGLDWHFEQLDQVVLYNPSEFASLDGVSLALDGGSQPHVSYAYYRYIPINEIDEQYLKYVWRDEVGWNYEIVVSGEQVGEYTSLAMDGSNAPHISYYDQSNGDLKYARWMGSEWTIQTVDSNRDVGSFTSVALDGSGNPHISYYDQSNGDLKYTRWTGSEWVGQTVDSDGNVGTYTSLSLNQMGNPLISYFDSTNSNWKYAQWLQSLFLKQQAVPIDGIYSGNLITHTLVVSGPGVVACLWDPLPGSVSYITNSITSTLSPPAIYSPTAHAIVWQGELADIAGIVQFQVTPSVSQTEELPPIVNTVWLTDTRYNRSVSSTIIVNGLRIYAPLILRND
jgi:hypothetical protein